MTTHSKHWRLLALPLLLPLFIGLPRAGAAPSPELPTLPVWDAATLTRHCDQELASLHQQLAQLAQPAPGTTAPTAQNISNVPNVSNAPNVLAALNALQIRQEDIEGPVYLLNNVSPAADVRQAADACLLKYNDFSSTLYQNTALYQQIRAVEPQDAIDAKLKQDLLDAFEDTGVVLAESQRQRMKHILERLETVRQEFSRNLRDDKTRLAFSPAEAAGLPEDYLKRAQRDQAGNLLLGFDYPDYLPFMENARDGAARQRYQYAYSRRGGMRNITLLDETLTLRRDMAALLGYPSYADFILRRRMAQTPAAVDTFLGEVIDKVRASEQRELEELRHAKAEEQQQPLAQVKLERWDIAYYQERLKRQRYDIDQEALRRYFPVDATIAWAMDISSQLYGLRFQPNNSAPLWHPDVRRYDVFDTDSHHYLGSLYLDLFPRAGKFTHAAAFGVRGASQHAGRTPISVLVTNINRQGLDFNELETMMHEFGHVLHGILSRTRYVAQAGTSVETDFVEAPSQMYEGWAQRLESVQQISRFCQGCPQIDAAMMTRLNAARQFGRGIRYARQHLYARYDMALYGRQPAAALETWQTMESATPLGHITDTLFPAQFEHILRQYGAGYYGYLWSEVLALDMRAAFGQNLMNPTVGRRFRQNILERGGERRASALVRDFLGRAPSSQAFFDEISRPSEAANAVSANGH